ncbi:MAG: hypothetical protein ACI9D5_002763 [Candidatus Endobugula sp.]|jgi:hypothetical protein
MSNNMTIPSFLSKTRTRLSDAYTDWREGYFGGSLVFKWALWALLAYALIAMVMGIYWSQEPDQFNPSVSGLSAPELSIPVVTTNTGPAVKPMVTGLATTNALIQVASSVLNKPGGYLSNDVFPPGVWLDNIPHWEYGALIQVRDLSKALREAFSRSQSQSTEDIDLVVAEPRFNFNTDSWIFPSSESVYQEGIERLERYRERLVDSDKNNAQFYARADNLSYWLGTVETRLGSLSQRLSASVGQRRINTDLAGEENASQATPAPSEMMIKTPWLEIDDVFYEARGTAWALAHFLRGVDSDFAEVLRKKNARISLRQIIRELEATQEPVYSVMILNGSGFGMLANHSLVMASYLSRAHAAIIDIRELLSQG